MDPNEGKGGQGDPPIIDIAKWREAVPEDIRNEPSMKDIKDIAGLAKGYVGAQKLIGNKISIPEEKDEAGWGNLYDKLGRPKTIEEYRVERPKPSDGVVYNEMLEKAFLPAAHKAGLNTKQVNAMIAWQNEMMQREAAQSLQEIQDAEKVLRSPKEWGNDYDKKMAISQRVLKDFAGQEVIDFLEKTKLGNHPAFIKFIYQIGHGHVEDGAPLGGGGGGGDTVESAKKKIDALMADPAFQKKYLNSREPGHKEAVEEVFRLREITAGG